MKRIQMLGATLFFLGWFSNAHASTIMFTDQTAWNSQVLGAGLSPTTIDFENTVSSVSGAPDWNTAVWTVTAGDVVFSSRYFPLEVSGNGLPYGSGKVLDPSHNQQINIELPSRVYAFGFDLGEFQGLFAPAGPPTLSNVVLSNGDVFAGPYYGISNPWGNLSPIYAFFGFISDLPISSLSMYPSAVTDPILDNFTYAQATGAAPVPEPMSLLLVGSGLGFMSFIRRRRKSPWPCR
jgi:hypothetical protein